MKISLGVNIQSGPFGGGNQFASALVNYLQQQGCQVSFDLKAPDLDIIVLAEPRPFLTISAYSDRGILRYLLKKNRRALVVHRVNECDERKDTLGVNQRLIQANHCADYTIFVSSWLRDLFLEQGMPARQHAVILNGSDNTIFHAKGYQRWNRQEPLKLVTHHWGAHWRKGFDIYQKLDQMLARPSFRAKFSLTYVGNLPDGFQFQHATYIEPKSGQVLADILRQHHVYLTASQNEPGSNHQNEGALCGLPLLYGQYASMPEYCQGFGLAFTAKTFEAKLAEMTETYDQWADRMPQFPNTAESTCQQYYQRFVALLENREQIIQERTWMHQPQVLSRALYPESFAILWYRLKRKLGLNS